MWACHSKRNNWLYLLILLKSAFAKKLNIWKTHLPSWSLTSSQYFKTFFLWGWWWYQQMIFLTYFEMWHLGDLNYRESLHFKKLLLVKFCCTMEEVLKYSQLQKGELKWSCPHLSASHEASSSRTLAETTHCDSLGTETHSIKLSSRRPAVQEACKCKTMLFPLTNGFDWKI